MASYKRTFVPQIDTRDCGVAALASIAKFYGSDFSLAHLRELAKLIRTAQPLLAS